MSTVPRVRIAIAHDYLTQRGGAERVVLALTRAFPGAPIYTALYDPERTYPEFGQIEVIPTWLNRFSVLRRFHRLAMPLLAWAVGHTKIDAAHTIMSSSGWAHGFLSTGSKVVYCYSPARWLYQRDAYLGDARFDVKRALLQLMSPFLKRWDKKRALSATSYFAISTAVQERIRSIYGIEAKVLPAPHSIDISLPSAAVDLGRLTDGAGRFYLCVARLLPYKNVDVVVESFNSSGYDLVVVGAGPEERRLRAMAGSNVLFLKDLPDSQMRWLYENCTAVLSASYEDFGLTPLEAAAYGKPSVVLRWGGFLDTIREGETGIYFDEPRSDLVSAAIELSRRTVWDSQIIRDHADRYSEKQFAHTLRDEIDRLTVTAA